MTDKYAIIAQKMKCAYIINNCTKYIEIISTKHKKLFKFAKTPPVM